MDMNMLLEKTVEKRLLGCQLSRVSQCCLYSGSGHRACV